MEEIPLNRILRQYKSLSVQVRALFWFLCCSFLQRGITFITTPVFTRILTTTEYGKFSVFNSWMQIITPIVSLNLYSGVYSQGAVKFELDRNRYSSSLQGLSLTLISAWLIIYLCFYSTLNGVLSISLPQAVAMFIMIWANGSFTFWSVDQRVDFKYRKLVLLTLAVSVIQPVIGILAVLHSDDKVTARILSMAAVQLVFYSGTFVSQVKKGRRIFDKQYWMYALKFNIPLLPHYLSLTILNSSDRIMISNMCGNDKAGIYNLAYSVSQIMVMFNTALLQTIEPWIYRKLHDNKAKELAKVAYPSFVMIAAVNLILIMFAPEIIAVFAPIEYYEAIRVIPSVAMSVFFVFLYSFFATFEFYYEKTKYVAAATVGGAVLNIILNFVFINKLGFVAAGYTTLVSYMLFAVLHYHFMKKICREQMNGIQPYRTRIILSISVGCLALGFSFLLLYKLPLIRYSLMGLTLIGIVGFNKKLTTMIKSIIALKKDREE